MNCPKCKAGVSDDSHFCSKCGRLVKDAADLSVSQTKTIQKPTISFGKVIAGKYKIIEEIGRGGMGIVYKAKDTRLDRTVALKFLSSELIQDQEAQQRFIQEAQAAAALNHPNICTIHEIDEYQGQTFIAMEYIQGRSLKQRLDEGPLAIDEAKDIALQVAEGLKEAHDKGIVHRDIKPANIMLTEKGKAKITDFGLAKLSGGTDLTKASTIMGTVAYMSPEQAKGDEVDNRTDIWSLGAMIYEMLTGERPFQKSQEHALIYAILHDEPSPLSLLRPEVPTPIELAIEKALVKKQSDRHQDINELIQNLKHSSTSNKDEKSIVVLPFDDLSPSKDNEYFSDGLTEEIISDLTQIQDILVISRSSAMTYKGTRKKIKEIGQELNVNYVLEGSVRKSGENLKITAQLIKVENDTHVWTEKYKGTLDDVFDIQEEVSQSIVKALKLKLSPEERKKITARPIDNAAAYDCYLRAYNETMAFTKDTLDRALTLLQRGIDIVGENALFFAGFALVYFQKANLGIEQDKNIERAEEYISDALSIDPELAEAHFVQASIDLTFKGIPSKAIYRFQQSLLFKPDNPEVMTWLSFAYDLVGKTDAAMSVTDRCIEIDPINPMNYVLKGINHFFRGRFDLAKPPILDMYNLVPESSMWQFWKSLVLVYNELPQEALDFIVKHVKEPAQDTIAQLSIFLKYVLRGKKDKIPQLLNLEFVMAAKRDCQFAWHVASFYAYLSDKKEALDWLEIAIERGFINYPFLSEHDKLMYCIRGDRRFKKLMERVKHEWENFEV